MKLPSSLLLALTVGTLIGESTPKHVMFLGGKGRTKVQVLSLNSPPEGNCDLIPDVPFDPQLAIGLRDKYGRAMVCGGNKNPSPKSCHILDRATNTWIPGPNLKRQREGASVTCLDNGVCWIFGGKSTSYTEFYNPDTNEFEIGPEMPVNSVHGLCTGLTSSGSILMVARREPGKLRAFSFDPSTGVFDEDAIVDLEGVDKRYAACYVLDAFGNDRIFMSGGGSGGITTGTNEAHFWDSSQDTWNPLAHPSQVYPHEIYGSVAIPVMTVAMSHGLHALYAGGITPSGEEPSVVYTQEGLVAGIFQEHVTLEHPPGAFPIVVTVDEEACPMEPPCGI